MVINLDIAKNKTAPQIDKPKNINFKKKLSHSFFVQTTNKRKNTNEDAA